MTAQPGDRTSSEHLDFAIVGAGVSGLYMAWRLLLDNPARRVRIFEMGDRHGGRLLTWKPLGPQGGLSAELGGMRFFSQQQLVWNLLPQLGFGSSDIVKFWVTGDNLRLLLRGRSTPLTVQNPAQRYDVPLSDQGSQAGEILEHAVQQVLRTPENWEVIEKYLDGQPPTDRHQWDEIKPYLGWRGRPLWNTGFWNLLADVLNSETYQFICDAFGYYSLAANWNAAEAMQSVFLDFTQNPDYQTLTQGYGAVPDRLASSVTQAGGEIVLNTRLVSFDRGRHDNQSWTLSLQGPDGPQTVDADHLVLAMPRRSLELLAPSGSFNLDGSPGLRRLVESVQPFPAFKMFLFYGSRWWERWGIERGRSVCDLPIRQTYYFAPRPQSEGAPVPPAGLLMASYSDARSVGFWRGMVPPQDEWEGGRSELRLAMSALARGNGLLGAAETAPEPPPHLHKASQDMLYHAKQQLALLHDISPCDIPDPQVGAFADWGQDPFGGGWNFWEPNVDVQRTMQEIKVPLGRQQHVYVVGEAYSGEQGWVEGALTSAEVTLQTHIGLSRPAWLPSTYYLGW